MNIYEIAHYASGKHGMSAHGPNPDRYYGRDQYAYTAHECIYGHENPETRDSLRFMVDRGYLELRTRTVDLGPPMVCGNWPEMTPHGVTTLRSWHLTDSGREAWLANDW